MMTKPQLEQGLLHPASNKAFAMNPDGMWLSYSHAPVAGETGWERPVEGTLCFRIPAMRAPTWSGKWQDSLVVFE